MTFVNRTNTDSPPLVAKVATATLLAPWNFSVIRSANVPAMTTWKANVVTSARRINSIVKEDVSTVPSATI